MSSTPRARARIRTHDGVDLDVDVVGDAAATRAVVLCHGFIQNAQAFAVPARSLADFLAARGHCVYALNLRGRRGGRALHDLATYVHEDAVAIVDHVALRHPHVAWVGHSMGGLIGVTLPFSTSTRLRAVVVLGAPLFPGTPSLHRLRVDRALGRLGRRLGARGVPFAGATYARAFVAARRRLEDGSLPWPLPLWRPGSLDEDDLHHALTRTFASDSHHVLADLVELVETNGAQAGRLAVSEALRALRVPLFAVAGSVDALAPPDAVHALYARAGSPLRRFVEVDAGHIDLVVGRDAPRTVWAPLAMFLDEVR